MFPMTVIIVVTTTFITVCFITIDIIINVLDRRFQKSFCFFKLFFKLAYSEYISTADFG